MNPQCIEPRADNKIVEQNKAQMHILHSKQIEKNNNTDDFNDVTEGSSLSTRS